MSGFSSLNVASSALAAQQRALDIAGQNIANAGTEGYTRQRVEMRSLATAAPYASYSVGDNLGEGVSADTVTRIRDAFAERRGQLEHGRAAMAGALGEAYTRIETSFGEPSTSGVQNLLTRSWAAWSQLSSQPTDPTARSAVLAATDAVVKGFGSTAAALDGQWNDTRAGAAGLVVDVNATVGQIADLNRSIRAAVFSGAGANDLMDQRDALVGRLADTIGATASETINGMVDVSVGGTAIVSGTAFSTVSLGGANEPGATPAGVTLTVAVGGPPLTAGGTLGGQLQALNTVIPAYRTSLDGVAAQWAGQVNTLQAGGYDAAGGVGVALLGPTDPAKPTGAGNLRVASTDGALLAAASQPPVAGPPIDPSADGGNADLISALARAAGGPDTVYRDTVTKLGVQARSALSSVASTAAVTAQADAARLSVSGVSLDEELTNMLAFKQSYAAAARLVTAVDEMLDILINRTGLVGR